MIEGDEEDKILPTSNGLYLGNLIQNRQDFVLHSQLTAFQVHGYSYNRFGLIYGEKMIQRSLNCIG